MRTVIITGGSSGIGLELASELIKSDCRIIIIDIQRPKKKIKNLIYIKFDFNKINLIKNLIKKITPYIINDLVLINNVAYRSKKNKDTYKYWVKMMNISLISSYFLSEGIIKRFDKNKKTIININSVLSSYVSLHESCAYHCAKASLLALNNYLSIKYLKSTNIFSIAMALYEKQNKKSKNEKFLAMQKNVDDVYPKHRVLNSMKLSEFINYLTLKESNFLNGSNFIADGGYLNIDLVGNVIKRHN